MATIKEEFESLKIRIAKGEGTHVIHVVDHDKEKQRKKINPSKSTKIILNCRTPEQWKEMHAAKEPYFEIAVDPQIAIDCMIRALSAFSKETIAEWVKQGFGPGEPPPKANIPEMEDEPEWLK